jgi:hypothetical protein
VVLAEPTDSLVLLDSEANGSPTIIWCDAHDLPKLPAIESMTTPNIWPTYADFFAYLLEQENDNSPVAQ